MLEAKARAQHIGVEFHVVKGLQLKGDSIKFDHIISNLLTNVIDAYDTVPDKKRKNVVVSMRQKGQFVEITVQDHGCGITAAQLPHLFEPFYTTKETVRGTGIGLTITKQAVEEAFQGTIEVFSGKQEGTRFVVRLPLT